jgi:hypothetical protein
MHYSHLGTNDRRLLAGQEEMKAKADADREQMLAIISVNMKAMQEQIVTYQAKTNTDRKNLQEMLKAAQ